MFDLKEDPFDDDTTHADIEFWHEKHEKLKDLATRLAQALSYEVQWTDWEHPDTEAILHEAQDVLKLPNLCQDVCRGNKHPLAKQEPQ